MNLFLTSLFVYIVGMVFGSFLNVVIFRLPRGESLGGRSHCMSCGKKLRPWELVPVLSQLVLRGKCSVCSSKISAQYPIVEFATGILFVAAYLVVRPLFLIDYVLLLRAWVIIVSAIVVFMIDLKHKLILDKVTYPVISILLVLNGVIDYIRGGFLSIDSFLLGGLLSGFVLCLFFFSFWYFSKGKWMGFGDVKYAWVIGLALGFPGAFLSVMVGSYIGVLFVLPLLFARKATMKTELPFGCFLTLGVVGVLLFSQNFVNLYINYISFFN